MQESRPLTAQARIMEVMVLDATKVIQRKIEAIRSSLEPATTVAGLGTLKPTGGRLTPTRVNALMGTAVLPNRLLRL
jgi:hypothetical protein